MFKFILKYLKIYLKNTLNLEINAVDWLYY